MPYALIPDGYSLKKVTKAQKSALDEHNRSKAIEKLAGTAGSPILLLVVIAAGLAFLASQFKLPDLSITSIFQSAFPQLAAVLGIKGELSEKGKRNLKILFEEGALALDPNATAGLQFLFPVGVIEGKKEQQKADEERLSQILTGLGI